MSLIERDKHSGYLTTGHDWNGIKELNTPIPRILLLCLLGTFMFAVGYWYYMPSWPLGDHYYPGKLKFSQRAFLAEQQAEAAENKNHWVKAIEETDFSEIVYNDDLMSIIDSSGARLFQDNCAVCHGHQGKGNEGAGYPALSDKTWLWGDNPEHIMETLRVGINSSHAQSRASAMPNFGASGQLDKTTIDNVVDYIRSEARLPVLQTEQAKKNRRLGEKTYAQTCIACHGAEFTGNQALGAPNLIDRYWLYGSDAQSVTETVWAGRKGQMPSWESRLEPYERKILAIYVTNLD